MYINLQFEEGDNEEDIELNAPSPQLDSSFNQETEEEEESRGTAPPLLYPSTVNGIYDEDDLGLTFEQETADELLADIQNAVDEMLQDFQTSPISINPPLPPPPVEPQPKLQDKPLAPKTAPKTAPKAAPKTAPKPQSKPKIISSHGADHTIYMRSKNGGFGFQVMGGKDSDHTAQVDYIVPGEQA